MATGCAAFNAFQDEPSPDGGATTDAGLLPNPMFPRSEQWSVGEKVHGFTIANADSDPEAELIVSTDDRRLLAIGRTGQELLSQEPSRLEVLHALDVDSSGKAGLIALPEAGAEIVFISDLSRRPVEPQRIALEAPVLDLNDVAVGEVSFENDAIHDLALATPDSVLLLVRDAEGRFSTPPITLLFDEPTLEVQFMDVDADGREDLVLLQETPERSRLACLLRTDNDEHHYVGPFELYSSALTSAQGRIRHMRVADLDGQGRPEIVVLANDLHVLHFDSGTMRHVEDTVLDPLTGFGGFALTDVTGEGVPDLFVIDPEGLWVLPSDQSVLFDARAPTRLETGTHLRLALGDLDGDARPDVATLRSLQPSDVAHLFLTKP